MMPTNPREPGREGGFALILAVLALMLLTFLGLTLVTTTSTELQISANYKWSEQAYHNAEAGVEVGRAVLRDIADWGTILPAARPSGWNGTAAPGTAGGGAAAPFSRSDASGHAARNFENWDCDVLGNGMGYGVVLDDGGANAPYQYKSSHAGLVLPGAFTLWVRRPKFQDPNTGNSIDYNQDDNNLILVAEGVAPIGGNSLTRAVRLIEVAVSKVTPTESSPCGTRAGQAGGGPEGANFGACDPITGNGLTGALTGTGVGTPTAIVGIR